MTFEEIRNDEQQYMMHTYGRFQTALVSGKGAVAKDVDGKEYVDFTRKPFPNRLQLYSIFLICIIHRCRRKFLKNCVH